MTFSDVHGTSPGYGHVIVIAPAPRRPVLLGEARRLETAGHEKSNRATVIIDLQLRTEV